ADHLAGDGRRGRGSRSTDCEGRCEEDRQVTDNRGGVEQRSAGFLGLVLRRVEYLVFNLNEWHRATTGYRGCLPSGLSDVSYQRPSHPKRLLYPGLARRIGRCQ